MTISFAYFPRLLCGWKISSPPTLLVSCRLSAYHSRIYKACLGGEMSFKLMMMLHDILVKRNRHITWSIRCYLGMLSKCSTCFIAQVKLDGNLMYKTQLSKRLILSAFPTELKIYSVNPTIVLEYRNEELPVYECIYIALFVRPVPNIICQSFQAYDMKFNR